jgi:hypothetical protein
MAYRSTIIEVRPNTSVDFFDNGDDYKAYIIETYEDTNKSSKEVTISDDGLTRTRVRDFDNKDTFDEIGTANEACIAARELRDAYNTENSISKEVSHGEV